MMNLLFAELLIAVVGGLWFLVAFGVTQPSPAGRHLVAVTAVMTGEFVALALIMRGVPVPLWVFAILFAAADAVVIHRLVLLHRARKNH